MKDKINEIIKSCISRDIVNKYSFGPIVKGYSAILYANVLINIDMSFKSVNKIIFKGNEELEKHIPSAYKFVIKQEKTAKRVMPLYVISIGKSEEELLDALNDLKDVIEIQQEWIFEQHPADFGFGCCSHYEECSNVGRCIMYDKDRPFYKGCAYKENLENGRIFYGEKSNV